MKYIAHLSTGGTVELFCTHELDPVKIEEIDWLLDDRGTLVRWSAVIALVSIIEPDSNDAGQREAPGEVIALIDRDDTRWMNRGEDRYSIVYDDGFESPAFYSREQIEDSYGPLKEVRSNEG